MMEEELKEQTKSIYSMKMWAVNEVHNAYGQSILYTRGPGGWIVDKGQNSLFIPIGKEKDLNTLDTPKVRI